jgi:hypothetical protein
VAVRSYFDVPDAVRGTLSLEEFINQVATNVAERQHPANQMVMEGVAPATPRLGGKNGVAGATPSR